MDYKARKELRQELSAMVDDCIFIIEENRFHPSVREAGDAPTENACSDVKKEITDFIGKCLEKGATKEDLTEDVSLNEIKQYILSDQEKNLADNVGELREIDSYCSGDQNDKYYYAHTIFQFKKENTYIDVCENRARLGHDDFVINEITVNEVQKKEKVTYEWA